MEQSKIENIQNVPYYSSETEGDNIMQNETSEELPEAQPVFVGEEKEIKDIPVVFVFDFETGGLECQIHAVTQIAVHAIRLDTFETIGRFVKYIHPYPYPYLLFVPALLISLIILSFNLLGDGLRDAFDPKLKN